MRVLIVDNNVLEEYWGSSDLRRYAHLAQGAVVSVRRGPHDDLPRDISGFDRIMISGSMTSALEQAPWISRLDELISRALDAKKPLLGVCYGHQRLAAVLGGQSLLRKSATPEFGWTRIEVASDSPLFEGLPKVFHSFSSHFDEVISSPRGTRLLASSEGCAVQAYQVLNAPAYGIQFHPEKSLEEGDATIASRRKRGEPKVLINPDLGKKLFDPSVGDRIFRNFLGQ